MANKKSGTLLSSSGKVEYAITNHVAFLEKDSVHEDFHSLMDFLKNSPVSYALTASPTIYAEIVEEMWSSACCSQGEIKLKIKGKSYSLTPSVINEALNLPNSNFESLPTEKEMVDMLSCINYASETSHLGQINRKYLRKEWSYFFDTLTRVFTGKCGGTDAIIRFILKIAYSLMYNKTIDIGSLLLYEFSYKLGDMVKRSKVIYYARFLMIIADHLCKELNVEDKNDTLQVFVQSKVLFSRFVNKNPHGEVEFVLPPHIQVQVSALYSSPSQVPLPSQSQSGMRASSLVSQNGKRKKTNLPTITTYYKSITVEGDGDNETSAEVHSPHKKMDASVVKPAKRLFNVDHEPPPETRDGVPVVHITSPEEENPKCDVPPLEPSLKPNSREEVLPDDRHHLANAASVLKSQLVARLTSSSEKLRTEDMTDLADRCYNALRELGDDYTSFRRDVYKLIAQHQKLDYAAKNKDNWDDRDIKARYNQQVFSLSNMTTKLSSAEDKLSRAETKREELKTALLRLTEELSEEEDRIKTLTAERNKCKEAHSDIEVEFEKLVAEKKKGYVAFEEINARYNTARREFERMSNQLLQSVWK